MSIAPPLTEEERLIIRAKDVLRVQLRDLLVRWFEENVDEMAVAVLAHLDGVPLKGFAQEVEIGRLRNENSAAHNRIYVLEQEIKELDRKLATRPEKKPLDTTSPTGVA